MVETTLGFGSNNVPGFTAIRESYENNVLFQSFFMGDVVFDPMPLISSTAVDSGNSGNTLILRPGLLLGKLDSDGSWVAYDPTATNGAQVAQGVLVNEVNMLDYSTGAAAARLGQAVVICGKIKAAMVLNLDQLARNQLMRRGFTFDDGKFVNLASADRVVPKTANYTITANDHGTLFTNAGASGAVTFTLPTIAVGLRYEFLVVADQNVTVTSAEGDNVIIDNDASADSIAFSTASHKIGGRVVLEAIYVAGVLKWMASGQTNAQTTTT